MKLPGRNQGTPLHSGLTPKLVVDKPTLDRRPKRTTA